MKYLYKILVTIIMVLFFMLIGLCFEFNLLSADADSDQATLSVNYGLILNKGREINQDLIEK